MNTNSYTKLVLRPKDASALIGCSLSTFWKLVKIDSTFPKPIKISTGMTGIFHEDLIAWVKSRPLLDDDSKTIDRKVGQNNPNRGRKSKELIL